MSRSFIFAAAFLLAASPVLLSAAPAWAAGYEAELDPAPFDATNRADVIGSIGNATATLAGNTLYAASCAGCHRANLAGGGDAPALGGAGFMSTFGNRSAKDLYNFIAASMPAGAPGSLSEQQYTSVTAYLLWANGAKPGTT